MRDEDPTVFSSGPAGSTSSKKEKGGRRKTSSPAVKAERTSSAPAARGIVRVRRETAGRGGKTVTTIAGVPASDDDLRALAVDLKRACGSGGTIKERVIEIQGDHRERIVALLEARGLTVKLAGG
jgi:translation initiation factor 1